MSFPSLLNRRVTYVPIVDGAEDRLGNPARAAGPLVANIPARRSQSGAGEDLDTRDQERTEIVYTLALRSLDRVTLDLSGRGQIVDGDDTFEIVGPPELVYRRRRPHHWRATVELVEG